jgi:hypothetical protein
MIRCPVTVIEWADRGDAVVLGAAEGHGARLRRGEPSRTAMMTGDHPGHPPAAALEAWVLDDPYALPLVGPAWSELQTMLGQLVREPVPRMAIAHTPPRRTGQDRPRRKIRKTGRHCRSGPQTATPDAQERVSARSTGTPEISTAQGPTAPRPDPISSLGGSHATSQPQAPSAQVRPVRRPPINDGRGSRSTATTTGTGENQRSSFPVRTPRGRAKLRPPPQQSTPEKPHTVPDRRPQLTSPRNQPSTRPAHSNIAS